MVGSVARIRNIESIEEVIDAQAVIHLVAYGRRRGRKVVISEIHWPVELEAVKGIQHELQILLNETLAIRPDFISGAIWISR